MVKTKATAKKANKKTAKSGVKERPSVAEARAEKVMQEVLKESAVEPEVQRLETWATVECPYCGENFDVHVTSDDDGQTMYEDCEVCCRPIVMLIHTEAGELQVDAQRS